MMVSAGHDGDGDPPGLYDAGYPAMLATVTPLGAMRATAGHDGNGDPPGTSRNRNESDVTEQETRDVSWQSSTPGVSEPKRRPRGGHRLAARVHQGAGATRGDWQFHQRVQVRNQTQALRGVLAEWAAGHDGDGKGIRP